MSTGSSSGSTPPGDAFLSACRTPDEQDTFAWAGMLFGLRKQHPALQRGEQQNISADDSAFAFIRAHDTHKGCSRDDQDGKMERLLIVVNNSDQSRQLSINTQETAAEGCTQFISATDRDSNGQPGMDGAILHVLVASHGFGLYQLR